jgi:hypothetical protein
MKLLVLQFSPSSFLLPPSYIRTLSCQQLAFLFKSISHETDTLQNTVSPFFNKLLSVIAKRQERCTLRSTLKFKRCSLSYITGDEMSRIYEGTQTASVSKVIVTTMTFEYIAICNCYNNILHDSFSLNVAKDVKV